MINFVTWPPSYTYDEGGQVTKLIIVVKMPCKISFRNNKKHNEDMYYLSSK